MEGRKDGRKERRMDGLYILQSVTLGNVFTRVSSLMQATPSRNSANSSVYFDHNICGKHLRNTRQIGQNIKALIDGSIFLMISS